MAGRPLWPAPDTIKFSRSLWLWRLARHNHDVTRHNHDVMGRTRSITKEIRACELRNEGVLQREVANELQVSVRTISRWETRWRRGDRPLSELRSALWLAFDADQNSWRRLRLLQSLAKVAEAQAREAEVAFARELLLGARQQVSERQSSPKSRSIVDPNVAHAARQLLKDRRSPQ